MIKKEGYEFFSLVFGLIILIPFALASAVLGLYYGVRSVIYDLIIQEPETDAEKLDRLKGAGFSSDHPIFKSKYYTKNRR